MGQDRHQDPLTKGEIEKLIAKAPEVAEGQPNFKDMTFAEARDAAVKIANERSDADFQKQLRATVQLGAFVGAYYSGLVSAGVPEALAETLTKSYNEWVVEQIALAASGIRAVKNNG